MSSLLLRKSTRTLSAAQWRRLPLMYTTTQQQRQNGSVSTYRYGSSDEDEDDKKIALVLGSSGCLGRAVTRHLATKLNMQVIGADVVDLPGETDTSLQHAFVQMPTWDHHPGVADVTSALVSGLSETLSDGEEIDAIVIASGGWQGDPPFPKPDVEDDEFMDGAIAYGQTIDKMMAMNLYPVLAAGYAANRFMADEGEHRYVISVWKGVGTCSHFLCAHTTF
jgi:NAD(P)-dependent dehydrogenase (short-subunit alcohol dehydrogenase family)